MNETDDAEPSAAGRMDAPVAAIMSQRIEMVSEDLTIRDAAKLMLAKHISGVPVTGLDASLVGVLSWTDIMRALHDSRRQSPGMELEGDAVSGFYLSHSISIIDPSKSAFEHVDGLVRDYMSRLIVALPENSTVLDAARLIKRANVHRLLVVDDNDNLAGIVTAIDIVHHVAG